MSHAPRMSLADFKKLKKGSKFKAKPTTINGIRFDSKAEAEMYLLLKADPRTVHIDVHPAFTLHGGIRYKPDFAVFRREPDGSQGLYVIEVKGVIKTDFRRARKLFDEFHPCAPLVVMRKTRRGWEEI